MQAAIDDEFVVLIAEHEEQAHFRTGLDMEERRKK